jgi:hypothetical protein
MNDLDIAMREMSDTEEAISNMQLPDNFHTELRRVRTDLAISPFVNLTENMCKWVILAYLRSNLLIEKSALTGVVDAQIEDHFRSKT